MRQVADPQLGRKAPKADYGESDGRIPVAMSNKLAGTAARAGGELGAGL
jgi:hypothetical protein